MKTLLDLIDGGASLAVRTRDGEILTLQGRGILPLWTLYSEQPEALRGAEVADKVIGRGSAAVLAAAGVRRYATGVISRDALALLDGYGVGGTAEVVADYIINRAGTGRCPLETRLEGISDLSAMLGEISRFAAEISAKK